MLQANPGDWFISIVCGHCSHRSLIFHDLNEGKADLRKSHFNITCPECQKEGTYIAEHYQHPHPASSTAT